MARDTDDGPPPATLIVPDSLPPADARPRKAGRAPTSESEERRAITYGPHWRRRRFLISLVLLAAAWLLMVALIHTGTPAIVYLVVLLPLWLLGLLFALRAPKALRTVPKKPPLLQRLSFTNRLILALIIFIGIYVPFTFISNQVIPYAPVVEYLTFAFVLFLLFWLVGRSVGVAPSVEALPPAHHRLHKQVVLPIDDPHYQRTLFLNFEFVDKGRGGKTLAKRLEAAMNDVGVEAARCRAVVEELEDYREGFRFGLGWTRRGRDRRSRRRERRNQVLRTVYTKFNQELEQNA